MTYVENPKIGITRTNCGRCTDCNRDSASLTRPLSDPAKRLCRKCRRKYGKP